MNFTSLLYLPLWGTTVFLYPRLPARLRPPLLLAASWGFFVVENPASFAVLLAVTAVTYLAGLRMGEEGKGQSGRKRILAAGVIFALGVLFFFKYLSRYFLPAGISFYTFQSLSYTIDVYRGKYRPEKSFFRYALFLAFFPQVVAGPIERPGDLNPQLDGTVLPRSEDRYVGGYRMLQGYAKKIVLADGAAVFADRLFAAAGSLAGPQVLAAGGLFALQIYADFSGYSDIAVGSARFLGIRLTENFDHPYLACGIRDFWRRWHITLGRWLTDYLYIPLGGNRKGKGRTRLNLLLVFAASGLWHGKGLHFLLWGIAHGLLLILEEDLPFSPGRWLTFPLVSLLWIVFRAPTLKAAAQMYAGLPFGWENTGALLRSFLAAHPAFLIRLACAGALLWGLKGKKGTPALVMGYLLFLLTILCLFANLAAGNRTPFIYFQF